MTPASPGLLAFIYWTPYVLFFSSVAVTLTVVKRLRRGKSQSLKEFAIRGGMGAVIFFTLFSTLLMLENALIPYFLHVPYEVAFPCVNRNGHPAQTLDQIYVFWSVSSMDQVPCH